MCPLKEGKSKKIISENVEEMQHSGYGHNQAVAASLNQARKSGAHIPMKSHKVKMSKGRHRGHKGQGGRG